MSLIRYLITQADFYYYTAILTAIYGAALVAWFYGGRTYSLVEFHGLIALFYGPVVFLTGLIVLRDFRRRRAYERFAHRFAAKLAIKVKPVTMGMIDFSISDDAYLKECLAVVDLPGRRTVLDYCETRRANFLLRLLSRSRTEIRYTQTMIFCPFEDEELILDEFPELERTVIADRLVFYQRHRMLDLEHIADMFTVPSKQFEAV